MMAVAWAASERAAQQDERAADDMHAELTGKNKQQGGSGSDLWRRS